MQHLHIERENNDMYKLNICVFFSFCSPTFFFIISNSYIICSISFHWLGFIRNVQTKKEKTLKKKIKQAKKDEEKENEAKMKIELKEIESKRAKLLYLLTLHVYC